MSTTTSTVSLAPSVVRIAAGGASLTGELTTPPDAATVVVFACTNADPSVRRENRRIAAALRDRGYATLLFDLLTPDEELIDATTHGLRDDLSFLARRLIDTIDWLEGAVSTGRLSVALVGEGTGAAAAFVAACVRPGRVAALVSHSERPDRASPVLGRVLAPSLLIVRGNEEVAVRANEMAFLRLHAPKEMIRLGSEAGTPDAADEVTRHTLAWFERHVRRAEPLPEMDDEIC